MDKSFYCYLVYNSAGDMAVHIQGCLHLTDGIRRIFLGSVYQNFQAINLARRYSSDVSLCPYCMGE